MADIFMLLYIYFIRTNRKITVFLVAIIFLSSLVFGQKIGMLNCYQKILLPPLFRCISSNVTSQFQNLSTNTSTSSYDIVICGGGLVGSSMACALGNSKYLKDKKILILDSGPLNDTSILKNPPDFHSNRVCAISNGSISFLKKIGVWDLIPRSQCVKKMQVWDACSESAISFGDSTNVEADTLCTITENNLLISASVKALQETNVKVEHEKKVVDCQLPCIDKHDYRYQLPPAKLQLNDGRTVETKLIIAADGMNSFLAKKLQLPKIGWDYNSNAVVATLQLSEECENNIAWQRFLPTGPIALLPLSKNRSSLVWSTTKEEAEMLCKSHPDDLLMLVNDAFWKFNHQNDVANNVQRQVRNLLSFVTQEEPHIQQFPPSVSSVLGPVQQFPLGLSHSNWYIKPRIAFIGDTVHRIHPLAGQGANMGFRDVNNLLKSIERSVYEGRDIGQLSSLGQYESKSQAANIPFLAMTDLLKRLYSTEQLSAVLLRSSGLTVVNSFPFLKDFFMKEAMK